jgi:hypothetical protein
MVYRIEYYKHKKGPQFKTKMRASRSHKPDSTTLENWNTYVLRIRNQQLPALASVYEPFVIHAVTCDCCEKIPRGEDTCPLKEQQLLRHARGRHSIYRRDD